MKRAVRSWKFWAIVAIALAIGGTLVPLMVFGSGEGTLTVTPYADVVRFEAHGVASLQVQIYDLSGNLLWDSGVVSGTMVDWDRRDEWGERLAYGSYVYLVQGWSAQGDLVLQKRGKLALLPGDKVELQQAPITRGSGEVPSLPQGEPNALAPMVTYNEHLYLNNASLYFQKYGTSLYRVGVSGAGGFQYMDLTGGNKLYIVNSLGQAKATFDFDTGSLSLGSTTQMGRLYVAGTSYYDANLFYRRDNQTRYAMGVSGAGGFQFMDMIGGHKFYIVNSTGIATVAFEFDTGRLGVGTNAPGAQLHVHNTADQPALRIEASSGTNLIEAYNTGSGTATGLVFRVERATGDVRADGAFYGAGFYTGSADVAEHINVSEPVEPGDVVEIDPDNPGHFRKARTAGSRLVAGVISTQPGVVLGSNSDPVEGEGDPRPVLALAGRVPVKVTTENGPIAVGDLLVAASKPGYAMRANDPASTVGAVIGKALEPFDDGEGFILVQVTLR